MTQIFKPVVIALKGKGPATLFRRVWTISNRYGLSAAKMDRALDHLSQLMHRFDCRATLPITTVALARNSPVIRKYQDQGIEFAVHGYRHVDHSQLSLTEQESQFRKAGQVFQNHGIHFTGFRCPYLRWNEATLTALKRNGFAYDSSNSLFWGIDQKHGTESYYRALEFYGAEPADHYPALPRLDEATNLVRIPYCLPDDESLIERLNWESAAERDRVWPAMFRQIHDRGELFTLGLHPERAFDCSAGLEATLAAIDEVAAEVWRACLSDIAAWWQARSQATVQAVTTEAGLLQLSVEGPPGVTLLLRSLEATTKVKPWFEGYAQAEELPCVVRATKKPFIGVSSQTSPGLQSFLKQQGYIIEVGSNPEACSIYLDRPSFSGREERAILSEIEATDCPLARLGRWPHGARSAFNVTGDIDALTFWDYSQRLWEK